MGEEEKMTCENATQTLQGRLDRGSKVLSAKDFQHTTQKESETVGGFIKHLDWIFRIAATASVETEETHNWESTFR